jgi:hypothetical protein
MKSQLTVVGLGGSLAKHSSSLAALKIALQGAEEAGAKPCSTSGNSHFPCMTLPTRKHLIPCEKCVTQSTRRTDSSGAAQCTTAQSAALSRMPWIG